ncbi:MAG TPA: TMEM175 family protein [Acidobacteriaceae bacterium]|nr:TMEM175 family protein [Acidobacteriaceae bacterium]
MQAVHEHIAKDGFRFRGVAMSRIDGFSDVVFGFALTLIVVSLEVPHTYNELHKILLGFVPFLICFVLLFTIWWSHFKFFRRYGLHDLPTVLINCTLLFMVLFYVYPLKFLFTLVAGQLVGATASEPVFTSALQSRELMIVYGLGFAGIYFCFAAMYFNAWRQREELRLSPLEKTLTLVYFWDEFGVACVGLICCIAARILPPESAGAAGFTFFLIGVWKTVHGMVSGRYIRQARASTPPEDSAPLQHH